MGFGALPEETQQTRRWPNIKTSLFQRVVFAGTFVCQMTIIEGFLDNSAYSFSVAIDFRRQILTSKVGPQTERDIVSLRLNKMRT